MSITRFIKDDVYCKYTNDVFIIYHRFRFITKLSGLVKTTKLVTHHSLRDRLQFQNPHTSEKYSFIKDKQTYLRTLLNTLFNFNWDNGHSDVNYSSSRPDCSSPFSTKSDIFISVFQTNQMLLLQTPSMSFYRTFHLINYNWDNEREDVY